MLLEPRADSRRQSEDGQIHEEGCNDVDAYTTHDQVQAMLRFQCSDVHPGEKNGYGKNYQQRADGE
jgi:hypothetical protein